MKTLIRTIAFAGMSACTSLGAAAAEATVSFSPLETFADFGYMQTDREQLSKEMAEHFIKKSAGLPANQTLKVEVLDVDLAGNQRVGSGLTPELRIIMGQSDWPSMHVRYTLTENGQVILSGEDKLRDLSYLQRSNRHVKDDSLRYEKQMVDDWFRERLGVKG